MASAYANQLSTGLDPGPCGMPEIHETERAVRAKVQALARMIESCNYVVVHTGAGMFQTGGNFLPEFALSGVGSDPHSNSGPSLFFFGFLSNPNFSLPCGT